MHWFISKLQWLATRILASKQASLLLSCVNINLGVRVTTTVLASLVLASKGYQQVLASSGNQYKRSRKMCLTSVVLGRWQF